MQRRNTCASEDTAIFDFQQVAGDGSRSIERERQSEKAPLAHLDGTSETDLKQCADKNLGTKFRKRGNPLYLAFLIGRAKSTLCAFLRLFAIQRSTSGCSFF